MENIYVEIKNKTATTDDTELICGNRYTVVFTFDSEWDAYETKTARFTYSQDGDKKHIDVPFAGNICEMPILLATRMVSIGVFAGDLQTTTCAEKLCLKSVLCDSGLPGEPPQSVYTEIVGLCNEAVGTAKSVEERADSGEFKGEKGDKGDAGAIKFIVVAELPDNPDESAIYLMQNGDTQEQNVYDEYIYTNGAWEKIGSASVEVDLTDYVKNTDYATSDTAGIVKVLRSNGLTVDSEGRIMTDGAGRAEIAAKQNYKNPIMPSNLDYAVKVGITTNTETLTDEEKAQAQSWLGVDAIVGDIETALDELHNYAQALIGGGAE